MLESLCSWVLPYCGGEIGFFCKKTGLNFSQQALPSASIMAFSSAKCGPHSAESRVRTPCVLQAITAFAQCGRCCTFLVDDRRVIVDSPYPSLPNFVGQKTRWDAIIRIEPESIGATVAVNIRAINVPDFSIVFPECRAWLVFIANAIALGAKRRVGMANCQRPHPSFRLGVLQCPVS